MAKIIVIISGKGGVGKTTSALNLGAAINHLDEDVIVVDANLTTPNIGLHLGAPIVPVSLNHVLAGKAQIADAIYEHDSGTKIVPASLSIKDMNKMDYSKLSNVAENLKQITDNIIFDCAAGLGDEALEALKVADEVIIITNPEMPAVTDAFKTAKIAEEMNKPIKGVIITRVRGTKTEMPISNINEMLEIPILGIIPEDSAIQEALAMKKPVVQSHPKSRAAKGYSKIAAQILGRKLEEAQLKSEGWLQKFLKNLKLRR